MKPLTPTALPSLLERIDHGKQGEIRSLDVIDPTTIQLRMSVQDRNRGFDWIDIIFEVNGVNEAKLIDDEKLPLLDMEHGISVLTDFGHCGIGLGAYRSAEALKDASLYLLGSGIKYAEVEFSG